MAKSPKLHHQIHHRIKHVAQSEQLKWHRRFIILLLLSLIGLWYTLHNYNQNLETASKNTDVHFGVTYSPYYAAELGLDPKTTFTDMLTTVGIKKVRLSAYWSKIEPQSGVYDFSDLDYYLAQAKEHNATVILAFGYKAPRWPECYQPDWLKNAPIATQRLERLKMIATVVNRYKSYSHIEAWQVENEPFFAFGECQKTSPELLANEVSLVRSISHKPVIVTDSGEYGTWITSMQLSDIFGTTLYRDAYFAPFGHLNFPIKPWYYRFKSLLVRTFFAPNNQKTIVIELQAEPWPSRPLNTVSVNEQIALFSPESFSDNIIYAKRSGFEDIYLWGVEWWYFMKDQGHPEYLQMIQKFNNSAQQ